MAIIVREGVFHLETANTLYQMKIDAFGVLTHLWYGAKTDDCMDYLLDYPDVGFSGNIYEAEEQRTYSLDTLPQEYAASGVGDFRVPAICVTHGDGSSALDLRYQEHHIKKGKYGIQGLPAVYAKETEAETLEITLKDTASEVEVTLLYGVLADEDVITRSVVVKNQGETPIVINRIHSLCMDIPYGDWEWVHFHGRHTMERQAERAPLIHGIQESSSTRGASSHQQNPTVLLCEKGCTETTGFCIGAALMYSGGFQTQVEKDQLEQVRIVMGINPDTFSWMLDKGECFRAPEVILSCSEHGMGELSHRFHHVIRNHVCRGKYKLSRRPVLINNWEATYFTFDEEKIERIAKQASELGIDMMVLDDGWFGKRDDDFSGLGDWFVNEDKMGGPMADVVKRVKALGMKFGIWIEPEMISEDSDLYREHPDWALMIPGRNPVRSRNQLVLDFSRKEVVDGIFGQISAVLDNANIEYVKWDMNRSLMDVFSVMTKDQGRVMYDYVLGLYDFLDRMVNRYPDLLIEGCSGGGGRFDAGMLYYTPQIWCSDNSDAIDRLRIQYGTSFGYPVSAMGAHVSAVPNHQTGRTTSLQTRGTVAMAGSFGYELDLNTLSPEEKEEVSRQVRTYKEYQELIYNGFYYRLSDPFTENLSAWEFVSEGQTKVLVQGVVFRAASNTLRQRIRLTGLKKNAKYRNSQDGRIYTAKALMSGGLLLPEIKGDDRSFEIYLERVCE